MSSLPGVAAAGLTAGRVLPGCEPKGRGLPKPGDSGLDHIVVLCMENRSFDHYLGWVKGAKGRQRGLEYLDDAGLAHPTHHLATYTGCGSNDPSHSYNGGRIQLNGGACDGFRRGSNDDLALGYYTRDDLALTSQLVDHFTVCDRWFAGILAPTYPNRFYTHSAATDRIRNTLDVCALPTVWDHLANAGVSAWLLLQRPALPRPVRRQVPTDLGADHRVLRRRRRWHPAVVLVPGSVLLR